ncbi:hypothetical protein GCM10010964_32480 [Caldovatus sediminis]|uniref:Uncharacterized protein n=1 Tax=Caldovatus sediminis TaxID=2041189 RepID=A0A8J3EDA3_9PROT|nr:hypothetical protein GCM10010964_32480 [Caldovatus sediminis]
MAGRDGDGRSRPAAKAGGPAIVRPFPGAFDGRAERIRNRIAEPARPGRHRRAPPGARGGLLLPAPPPGRARRVVAGLPHASPMPARRP